MAKREKEQYLDKKAKILARAFKEEDPTGENRETLWEKNSVPTVRRGDIEKKSVLTEKRKGKRKSDSDCHQIQGILRPRDKHSLGR
jgi:hypothetical protein